MFVDTFKEPDDRLITMVDGILFQAKLIPDKSGYHIGQAMPPVFREAFEREWRRGRWFYGELVITAHFENICISNHLNSQWGLVCTFDDAGYMTDVANKLLLESIDIAKGQLGYIAHRLNEWAEKNQQKNT